MWSYVRIGEDFYPDINKLYILPLCFIVTRVIFVVLKKITYLGISGENTSVNSLLTLYMTSTLKDKESNPNRIFQQKLNLVLRLRVLINGLKIFLIKNVTGEFHKCRKFHSHFLQTTFPLNSDLQLPPSHRSTC